MKTSLDACIEASITNLLDLLYEYGGIEVCIYHVRFAKIKTKSQMRKRSFLQISKGTYILFQKMEHGYCFW